MGALLPLSTILIPEIEQKFYMRLKEENSLELIFPFVCARGLRRELLAEGPDGRLERVALLGSLRKACALQVHH